MFRILLSALSNLLPAPARRWLLRTAFGYEIHPTARLGFCLLLAKRVIMEEHSAIGNLTVCIHLDLVHLGRNATIGRGNWITGFPSDPSAHFAHEAERRPELIVGEHAAITNRHLIDCTNKVTIGRFTTFAGFQSQILTHSIDIEACRQSSAPVTIGEYCFVGTNCVLLGGSVLPSFSVLGAKSLLNKSFTDHYSLYGGTPAQRLKEIPADAGYFRRTVGMVI